MKRGTFVVLALLIPLLSGCLKATLVTVSSSSVIAGLSLSPTTKALAVGNSATFTASNGTPPYVYSIVSGNGSIASSTGLYTAPGTTGTATLKVTDAIGNTATATVTIASAIAISPSVRTITIPAVTTPYFAGSGAVPPYSYSVQSGGGSINSSTGAYTPPTAIGNAVVQVTDDLGNSATSAVELVRNITNGRVDAFLKVGSALYLGGYFTSVHPLDASTKALALDSTTYNPTSTCDWQTGFDALINAMVVSGNSIYVAGNFTSYAGQSANYIAKLDKTTCALDTTFSPSGSNGFNASAYALAVSGTSLYVGGNFTAYRGSANSALYLAKLDLTTGAIDTVFSPPGAGANGVDNGVRALVVDGTSLYVGGSFTAYRGVANSANRLAKVDLTSGVLDTVFSPVGAASNGFGAVVRALHIAGGALYVGGDFTTYKGVAHSARFLAKLDPTSGVQDTVFSPPGSGNNGFGSAEVYALASTASSLYVGGSFTNYRGVANSANKLAKLDLTTGVLDTVFSPVGASSNGFDNTVHTLLVSGGSLYVGGAFAAYKGSEKGAAHIAKIDPVTGAIDTSAFIPSGSTASGLGGLNSEYAAAIAISGSTIYLGGEFTAYGGLSANRIAKIDATSFELDTTFSPSSSNGFNSAVSKITGDATQLYVGGAFTAYRDVANSANYLAKLDSTTGAIDTAFSPVGANANGFNNTVSEITIDGSTLWVGGEFTAYKGVANSARRIAKLDATTGVQDTVFSPAGATANGFDNYVASIAVSGTTVYAGGGFSQYKNVADSAHFIAKLHATTGVIDTVFSPVGATSNGFQGQFAWSGSVSSVLLQGGALYVGGEFVSYRGVANSAFSIAKLDPTTGDLDTVFSPPGATANGFGAGYIVSALAATASSLYVGGAFTAYRGVANSSRMLAKLDLTSGDLDTVFSPPANNGTNSTVSEVYVSGTSVYIGGLFTRYRTTEKTPYVVPLNVTTGVRQD